MTEDTMMILKVRIHSKMSMMILKAKIHSKNVNDNPASRLYDSPVLMNSNENTKQFEEDDDDPPWLYDPPWNDGRNPSYEEKSSKI